MTEDYAVIAILPGLDPARSVMIFAGTTTFGTQGAVEYVCRPDSLKQLLSRLSSLDAGRAEAVRSAGSRQSSRGVPVETELVAVRR